MDSTHHALVRIHKNSPFHGERTSNATPIHKTGPLYGQDWHKADRAALGTAAASALRCLLAYLQALVLVCLLVL